MPGTYASLVQSPRTTDERHASGESFLERHFAECGDLHRVHWLIHAVAARLWRGCCDVARPRIHARTLHPRSPVAKTKTRALL
jgi:hypothetical protein